MPQAYSWSSQRHHPKVDPQIVGETIESIVARDGLCAPGSLVEAARPDTSPLHSLFTWDDGEAAGKWRTHEARQVINLIRVVVPSSDGEPVEAPAFVSVGHIKETVERGEGYRPLAVVTEDDAFRSEAMQTALRELSAIRRRYQAIQKLNPVWAALDAVAAD